MHLFVSFDHLFYNSFILFILLNPFLLFDVEGRRVGEKVMSVVIYWEKKTFRRKNLVLSSVMRLKYKTLT